MEKNEIRIFENPEFGKVRTMVDHDGNPLFCGKDVCEVLGYKQADKAISRHTLESDRMKRTAAKKVANRYGVCEGKFQLTEMLFVNESGFYCLVFGSKLPIAQRFKQWVTSVVLPQIRKTGGYIPVREGDTYEEVIRRTEEVLRRTLDEKEALRRELDKRDALIDHLLPSAQFADSVLQSISCYTTTEIAKELGMTAQELNRQLCGLHIQYFQSGHYMLYAEYKNHGLAKTRTHCARDLFDNTLTTRTYLVWTEKGRRFLHEKVKR